MSDFDRRDLFVVLGGKKHLAAERAWGSGMDCEDKFVMGERVSGLESDVDCKRCRKTLGGTDG